jgi:RNA polymerase sigma factor (sigma-70 family)
MGPATLRLGRLPEVAELPPAVGTNSNPAQRERLVAWLSGLVQEQQVHAGSQSRWANFAVRLSPAMGAFRHLGEAKLAELGDEELIEYVIEARNAGEADAAELALRIFAFGMEGRLLNFVRVRLESHPDTVIEEVAEVALADAIRSINNLRGASAGEARAFVFKIARFRIIDFHRTGRVSTAPLEIDGREGEQLAPGSGEAGADGGVGAVEASLVVEECLAELREDHRAVVEYTLFEDCPARETAEKVNSRFDGKFDDSMSDQNVHQIVSRFRKVLRKRLEGTGKAP